MATRSPAELPRGMRRLVIRGETWGWRFGQVVPIVAPDGRRFRIDLRDLTGLDWYEIERGTHKKYFSAEPRQIVDFIDRQILGYKDATGFPLGILPRGWNPPVRKGFRTIEGPRGTWQWRPHPFIIQLYSPEDVGHSARIYHLLDMTTSDWADIKAAAIVASGSTVDQEMRRGREMLGMGGQVEGFLGWDGPGLPQPTDRQVLAHIERRVAGMPEKSPA